MFDKLIGLIRGHGSAIMLVADRVELILTLGTIGSAANGAAPGGWHDRAFGGRWPSSIARNCDRDSIHGSKIAEVQRFSNRALILAVWSWLSFISRAWRAKVHQRGQSSMSGYPQCDGIAEQSGVKQDFCAKTGILSSEYRQDLSEL